MAQRIDRIRGDHLAYLVKRIAQGDEAQRKSLELQAQSGNAAQRNAVLSHLDTVQPGTSERLRRLWTPYGSFTLFLFEAPALVGLSLDRLPAQLDGLLGRGAVVNGGPWHVLPAPKATTELDENSEAVTERIHRVALSGHHLLLGVRITKVHKFVYEDEESEFPFTYDINVAIDFSSPKRLSQVYGAQVDSKKAMRTVLEFLVPGEKIPQRNPGLGRFLVAIKFNETQIKALAAAQHFDLIGMVGPDAQGIIGRVGYEGMASDAVGVMDPLDMNDERVSRQDACAQEERTYNFAFDHPLDGFKEVSQVQFLFNKRQPKLSFPARATRVAMETIIQHVYAATRG